jgi:uncharacterized protein with PIN domain
MKKNREKLEAEFLAEAKDLFDELMDWDDENAAPNLTQIEDLVLELRQRFGERITEKLLLRQEQRQPAERVICPKCGDEMRPKGPKLNQVETRIGNLKIEREHFYCPRCQLGIFPPGSAADDLGEALE